jgi:hypothetical protein
MKKNRQAPDFKEIYTPPFENHWDSYFFSSNGVMSFTLLTHNERLLSRIEECLNSETPVKVSDNVEKVGIHIKIDGKKILLTRGWGHLTGIGALNLPTDIAAKVQDDFIDWTVSKLKGDI